MKNTSKINKAAFSEMISAFRYFDIVDEGCGYDMLNAKKDLIRYKYQLTEDQLSIVENWSYNKYYSNNN
jgi:hypothetical protein